MTHTHKHTETYMYLGTKNDAYICPCIITSSCQDTSLTGHR